MELWNTWYQLVNELEAAFSRKRAFYWMVIILIGFTIKFDSLGVTSIARGAGILPNYYTCLLNFFNSNAVNLKLLRNLWTNLILTKFNGIVRVNDRVLIVGDGIKIAKEGKKMPAVKWLHQESESNSKANYIMGHSIQAIALLVQGLSTYFAVPITCQIHEGIRMHWRDNKTLLDKMFGLLMELELPEKFYFVADKYYCSGRFMKQLIDSEIHLVTMMKKNAVVYLPLTTHTKGAKKSRGRPKKYGDKIKLFELFKTDLTFIKAPLPSNKKFIIEYCVKEFFWRPLGEMAQFVFVKHPTRGLSVAMSTDRTIKPIDIIFIYSLRFKIEVSFKQAVHQIGAFTYRFWLKCMLEKKRGTGNQHLQFAPQKFKEKVLKKISSYHLFMQLGCIAQGLLQYLSIHCHQDVWSNFKTWIRTVRNNVLPSEMIVSTALRRTYIEFLFDGKNHAIFKKFIRKRIDIRQIMPSFLESKKAA